MTKKQFYIQVLILAVPIALQNLLTALLNIFDQMMVGWLPGGIADAGLSAVLLANQIVFIFQIVVFAVCNTVNIFIAQYTENGNEQLIKIRAGFTFLLIFAVSLAFMLVCHFAPGFVIGMFNPSVTYRGMAEDFLKTVSLSFIPMGLSVGIVFMLRAVKRLKAALVVNILAVALNFFLNYTFMFGLLGVKPMGLIGAAYGTIFSRCFECVAMIAVLFALKNPLIGNVRDMFRFDGKFIGQYFKMFFPILCNEIFWVLSTTVFLFVYDKLDNSEVVLASVNIAQSLDKIVSVVMIGVGSATGVVVGNIIGRGVKSDVNVYAREALKFGLYTGLAVAVLTFGAAFVAPLVFSGVSEETHLTARNLIMLYALTAPLRTVCFTEVIGILRSGGDTTFCMIAETVIVWVVSVPLVMVCGLVFKTNVYVVYLMANVCEVLKLLVFGWRIFKGKWIKFGAGAEDKVSFSAALAAVPEGDSVYIDTNECEPEELERSDGKEN